MPREMIRAVVVDDEPLARKRVKTLLKAHPDVEVVGEAGDGRQAVAVIRDSRPDLVFLDIQMPERDGFGVIEDLGPLAPMPVFVFVTAHDKYAVQAFDVNAIDYLLKPLDEERFGKATARAKAQVRRGQPDDAHERLVALVETLRPDGRRGRTHDRILVKSTGKVFFLKASEVDWIEAAGNYARLHVGKDEHLIRETMSELEGKLDAAAFVRIHRSTLVNLDRIKEMHPWFSGDYAVILKDGTQLRLSRGYRDRLQAVLGDAL